jgi:oligopeptide transport system permease protein
MIKVIVGRLLQLIPVLVVILTLTFFMSKMVPGGPFSAERQATPEVIARLNAYYGLDKPLWEQYLAISQELPDWTSALPIPTKVSR